ncbi:periplasmic serine protease, Do/DeqQ family [Beggiatoa alba B18LD]|uniref:Periplasmic serine protease, Do/DeqQ family n=1 Tax=Beggiatoa alba B18LD TaxID=395493 RepID=I3CIN3_9GAMM|nr:DegQ family serine endoprotease [Beggiatoa alba]EIJ43476.1 periplasmic serine protease, Do/DeqQ family [Beggiatoa alba B18LD]
MLILSRLSAFLSFILLACSSFASFAYLPVAVDGQPVPSLAPMLEKITPAVVNISTKGRERIQENPLFNDPFFRHFFELPEQPREKINQSLGSGVVINASLGYVVTNNHVIEAADEISVTLRDGRQLSAKLVGTDPQTDLALLKILPENLVAIPLANSDSVRVGDFVVAIGNPFGLGQTVTSGIVSALGRSIGIEDYEDFIQTDASINPGNSGGALVNLRGELIGINTAILAPGGNGGNIGIGFAIPTNMMNQIIQHLIEYGEVQRGTLGIRIQDINAELANAFGLKENKGAAITGVERGSAAEQAGLQAGDVIISVNDKPVSNATELRNRIGLLRIQEKINIGFIRNGKLMTVKAKIDGTETIQAESINRFLAGMRLKEDSQGVVVHDIKKNSSAWQLGFRKGDVIVGISRRVVKDIAGIQALLDGNVRSFSVQIDRNGEIFNILVR